MNTLHRPARTRFLLAFVALLAGSAMACSHDLGGAPASGERSPALRVSTDPPGSLEAAPRVLRFVIGGALDEPAAFYLFRGELGPQHLALLSDGDLPHTLLERRIEALTWSTDEGVVLAPTTPLEPGERYTLASAEPRLNASVMVAPTDPLPTLRLAWPPGGLSPSGTVGVWCGALPMAPPAPDITLAPGNLFGQLASGVAATDPGRLCVHLGYAGDPPDGPVLASPLLLGRDGLALARLDPRPLARAAAEAAPPPALCGGEWVGFGRGCATVLDDRILVRGPAEPTLWSIAAADGSLEQVDTTADGSSFVIMPLPPASAVALTVHALDGSGAVQGFSFFATTSPPLPHVVINEVLANSVGPEPEQEWIELYNDGLAPAPLGDYTLIDVGGETPLPAVMLPPGAFALLVNESYDHSGEYDPPPAAGTVMLYVPKLGKGGLKNDGEPLKLVDGAGATLSRFPAHPKPMSGRSVMRVDPKASDDVTSFVLSPEGGSTPGAPNHVGAP